MGQYVGAVRIRQVRRQIDLGPQESQYEWRGHRAAGPDLSPLRDSLAHRPPQAHRADHAPEQHRQHAQRPQHGAPGKRRLPKRRLRCLRHHGSAVHGRGRHRRSSGRRIHQSAHGTAAHSACGLSHRTDPRQVKKAPKPCHTYRAGKPEPHRQPQAIAVPGRCAAQRRPDRQHQCHHRQRRHRHG